MSFEPVVYIVDDDQAVRDSITLLMKSVGMKTKSYRSADEFWKEVDAQQAGCLILDVRMIGMSGLELQDRMRKQRLTLPIIFISGHGDIPMAARTIKQGAIDFLTKPFNDQELIDCIQRAIGLDSATRRERHVREQIERSLGALSPREYDVLRGIVSGKSNKQCAFDLGLSEKTVEKHRASVMEKMQAESVAELVQKVLKTDVMGEIPMV